MSSIYQRSAAYYDCAPIYQARKDKDFYLARARAARSPAWISRD